MPYRQCQQCKKRLCQDSIDKFCGSVCACIYNASPDIHCKFCKTFINKKSVTKRQFCNNNCANNYQKEINKVTRICINCNNVYIVQKSSHKYKLCSVKCEQEYAASDVRNDKRMAALITNNLQKYNVKYTVQRKEVIEKTGETKLLKYGDVGYNNLKKSKQTKLDRYGTDGYNNANLANKTKLEKYGTLNVNHKSNKTKLKKYGTLDFTDKSNKTKLKKYGTLDFTDKARLTTLIKYGP